MDEESKKQIALHVAGAAVRHSNPFEVLKTHQNEAEMDRTFIEKWVIPVYMTGLRSGEETLAVYRELVPQLTDNIVLKLLGEFNWRSRIAGAYFAVMPRFVEVEDVIGTHLLKSEVCYAGRGYCLALAAFETRSAQRYVRKYLDYYLQRPDLDFDQSSAIGALAYFDKIHGSNHFTEVKNAYDLWREQASYRQSAKMAISQFQGKMEQLAIIRDAVRS